MSHELVTIEDFKRWLHWKLESAARIGSKSDREIEEKSLQLVLSNVFRFETDMKKLTRRIALTNSYRDKLMAEGPTVEVLEPGQGAAAGQDPGVPRAEPVVDDGLSHCLSCGQPLHPQYDFCLQCGTYRKDMKH